MKQMFSDQMIDLMARHMYYNLEHKRITKANIKKSIRSFENMWLTSIREIKRNEKRKV